MPSSSSGGGAKAASAAATVDQRKGAGSGAGSGDGMLPVSSSLQRAKAVAEAAERAAQAVGVPREAAVVHPAMLSAARGILSHSSGIECIDNSM